MTQPAPEQKEINAPDEVWMQEALRCAQRALDAGEVPVGAIVICGDRIVGRGWNRNISDSDPTAHAEVMALRNAGSRLGRHLMPDAVMYSSSEPCPMCLVACYWARISRLASKRGSWSRLLFCLVI